MTSVFLDTTVTIVYTGIGTAFNEQLRLQFPDKQLSIGPFTLEETSNCIDAMSSVLSQACDQVQFGDQPVEYEARLFSKSVSHALESKAIEGHRRIARLFAMQLRAEAQQKKLAIVGGDWVKTYVAAACDAAFQRHKYLQEICREGQESWQRDPEEFIAERGELLFALMRGVAMQAPGHDLGIRCARFLDKLESSGSSVKSRTETVKNDVQLASDFLTLLEAPPQSTFVSYDDDHRLIASCCPASDAASIRLPEIRSVRRGVRVKRDFQPCRLIVRPHGSASQFSLRAMLVDESDVDCCIRVNAELPFLFECNLLEIERDDGRKIEVIPRMPRQVSSDSMPHLRDYPFVYATHHSTA